MKSEKLKQAIMKKYGSVRSFAIANDIAPSTLQTALEKGLFGLMHVIPFTIQDIYMTTKWLKKG